MGIKKTIESLKLALGITVAAAGSQACASNQMEAEWAPEPIQNPQDVEMSFSDTNERNERSMEGKRERVVAREDTGLDVSEIGNVNHAAREKHRRQSAANEEISR